LELIGMFKYLPGNIQEAYNTFWAELPTRRILGLAAVSRGVKVLGPLVKYVRAGAFPVTLGETYLGSIGINCEMGKLDEHTWAPWESSRLLLNLLYETHGSFPGRNFKRGDLLKAFLQRRIETGNYDQLVNDLIFFAGYKKEEDGSLTQEIDPTEKATKDPADLGTKMDAFQKNMDPDFRASMEGVFLGMDYRPVNYAEIIRMLESAIFDSIDFHNRTDLVAALAQFDLIERGIVDLTGKKLFDRDSVLKFLVGDKLEKLSKEGLRRERVIVYYDSFLTTLWERMKSTKEWAIIRGERFPWRTTFTPEDDGELLTSAEAVQGIAGQERQRLELQINWSKAREAWFKFKRFFFSFPNKKGEVEGEKKAAGFLAAMFPGPLKSLGVILDFLPIIPRGPMEFGLMFGSAAFVGEIVGGLSLGSIIPQLAWLPPLSGLLIGPIIGRGFGELGLAGGIRRVVKDPRIFKFFLGRANLHWLRGKGILSKLSDFDLSEIAWEILGCWDCIDTAENKGKQIAEKMAGYQQQ